MKWVLAFILAIFTQTASAGCENYMSDPFISKVQHSELKRGDVYFSLGFFHMKANSDIRKNQTGLNWLECAVKEKSIFASAFLSLLYHLAGDKKMGSFFAMKYADEDVFDPVEYKFINAYGGALPLHAGARNNTVESIFADWLSGDPLNYKQLAIFAHYSIFGVEQADLSSGSYKTLLHLEKCNGFKPAIGMAEKLRIHLGYSEEQAIKMIDCDK